MKKTLSVLSVLALAACGGGSGGPHTTINKTPPLDLTLPDGVRAPVANEVAESNSHVTGMKSEILVASSGNRTQAVRSSHTPYTNASGVTFISYDPEDVKLRPAAYEVPENAHLKIGLDENGKVKEMTMVMGEINGQEIGGALTRIGDSARFHGPIFEYVEDKYAKINGDATTISDEAMLDTMKTVVAQGFGLQGGEWVQPGGAGTVWKYQKDGNFVEWDYNHDGDSDGEIAISDNGGAMRQAIQWAHSFDDDDGKWEETANGQWKFRKYGDNATYRIADDGTLNMAGLNTIRGDNQLPELGHWNRIEEEMEIVSLGAEAGLKYSDFGHFNPVYRTKQIDLTSGSGDTWNAIATKTHNDEEIEHEFEGKDYQLFAGGYAINGTSLLPTLLAPRNTTFHGNAIGRVYVSIESNTGGVDKSDELLAWNANNGGHDMTEEFTTTNATLTIDANGKEKLNMPFANFYTVDVEKNGNDVTTTFTGTPTDEYQRYRVNNAPDPESIKQAFRPGYYGVGVASEAAGTLYYKTEQDIGIDEDAGKVTREWEFQGAYGLKK